jgi:hypothetical protein
MNNSSYDKKPIGPESPNNRGESTRLAAYLHTAEWTRLPRSGERNPICALSRSTMNELVLPCAANNFRPPVRSIVIKKRGATRGIRLIHVPALIDFLNALADEAKAADDEHHVDIESEKSGAMDDGGVH